MQTATVFDDASDYIAAATALLKRGGIVEHVIRSTGVGMAARFGVSVIRPWIPAILTLMPVVRHKGS